MAGFLFVDDDPETRDLATDFFAKRFPDETLFTAADYAEAVKIVDREKAGLAGIVSDFAYPGTRRDCGGADLYYVSLMENIPFTFFSGTASEDIHDVIKDRFPDEPLPAIVVKTDLDGLAAAIGNMRALNAAKRPAFTGEEPAFPKAKP